MNKKLLPASHFSLADLQRNVACIHRLLRDVPAPARWLETFAGFGYFTELLSHLWPAAEKELWDLDPECARILRGKFPGALVVEGDSIARATPKEGDGVILDYSVATLRTVFDDQALLSRVFAARPAFVTVTDSGVNKLHLNWRGYGLTSSTRTSYFEAYRKRFAEDFGYHVVRAVGHARAAYLLLLPEARALSEERL